MGIIKLKGSYYDIKHHILSQNRMNLLIIICLLISRVVSHEIFTRTQLRGLYHQHLNRALDAEIQTIIKGVIAYSESNKISYTYLYQEWSILSKFEDVTIVERLQNILVDSNITIVGPKCCDLKYPCQNDPSYKCKFINIDW